MQLYQIGGYEFENVALQFEEVQIENTFRKKNNKTLSETLRHKRYMKFSDEVKENYPNSLGKPLGEFLYELKINGDQYYRRFLNRYGDG